MGVKFVTDSYDSNEHKANGNTREKQTFALRVCCLLLICATVVIAATLAHVGLLLLRSPCKKLKSYYGNPLWGFVQTAGREKEKRENNAQFNGHYVCTATLGPISFKSDLSLPMTELRKAASTAGMLAERSEIFQEHSSQETI